MWTNNMKKLISYIFATGSTSGNFKPILTDGTEYVGIGPTNIYCGTASTTDNYYVMTDESVSTSGQQAGKFQLLVGTGTTEPTVDDYKLENQIILTLVSFQCTNSQGTLLPTVTHTMTNNTGNTITVTEIGLYFTIRTSQLPCLLGRKLLDTPVTMEDGQSYTFQYNVDLRNLAE